MRSNHLGAEGLGPPAQLAIRGDQHDPISRLRSQVNKRVVTAAGSMDDFHAFDNARLDSIASSPFEDDNNRFAEPA